MGVLNSYLYVTLHSPFPTGLRPSVLRTYAASYDAPEIIVKTIQRARSPNGFYYHFGAQTAKLQSSRTVTSIVVLFPFFKVTVIFAFPGPFPTSIPFSFSAATDSSELLQAISSRVPSIGSL